jgi:putative sigma-54 modulation protein
VRTIVKGKNLEVPDRVRAYAERKLRRLDRYLDDRSNAVLELSNEQHRSAVDAHIAEVTLVIKGQPLRSHAAGPSYQAAIDTVVDRAERQATGHLEKPRVRARPIQEKAILRRIADGTAEDTRERRIVKTKRFAIEPMFEEDALNAMDELGHEFFVFVNAENERLAILYRRRDGDLGLIEPVVAGEYTTDRNGSGRTRSAQTRR